MKNPKTYLGFLSYFLIFFVLSIFIKFLFTPYVATQLYMIKTVGDCKELDEAIKRASFEIEKELLYMPYGNSKFFRFIPSLKFVKLSEDTENIGKNWKLVITIKSKDEHGIYKDCVEMYAINKGKMQCMGRTKLHFLHENNAPYTINEIEKELIDLLKRSSLKFHPPADTLPYLEKLKYDFWKKVYRVT